MTIKQYYFILVTGKSLRVFCVFFFKKNAHSLRFFNQFLFHNPPTLKSNTLTYINKGYLFKIVKKKMKQDKNMLVEAIKNTELLPKKQKLTLEVLCLSEYPLSSKMIENKLNASKQQMDYSLKSLMKRNFIIREKDGRYVYRPNYIRIEELIKRHKNC